MKKPSLLLTIMLVLMVGLFITGCPKKKETTDVNKPEVKAPAEKAEQPATEKK